MPKKVAKIEDAVAQHKLRKLLKLARVDEKEFIRDQGALLARDMAKATPPFASGVIRLTRQTMGTTADKKQGEAALWRDLLKLFSPQEAGVIKWAKRVFKGRQIYRGKKQTGAGVITSIEEIGSFHRKNQISRGRTRSLKQANKFWVPEKTLKRYFNREKKRVGRAKASFARAMVDINPKQKVPVWIKRNFSSGDGKGNVTTTGKGTKATVEAHAPGADRVTDNLPYLIRFRVKAMEKRLKFIIRGNAKQVGFKVN